MIHLLTTLIAGAGTTAITMCKILYHVFKNLGIRNRLEARFLKLGLSSRLLTAQHFICCLKPRVYRIVNCMFDGIVEKV